MTQFEQSPFDNQKCNLKKNNINSKDSIKNPNINYMLQQMQKDIVNVIKSSRTAHLMQMDI